MFRTQLELYISVFSHANLQKNVLLHSSVSWVTSIQVPWAIWSSRIRVLQLSLRSFTGPRSAMRRTWWSAATAPGRDRWWLKPWASVSKSWMSCGGLWRYDWDIKLGYIYIIHIYIYIIHIYIYYSYIYICILCVYKPWIFDAADSGWFIRPFYINVMWMLMMTLTSRLGYIFWLA